MRGSSRGDPPTAEARRDPNTLISAVASTAAVSIALTVNGVAEAASERPWAFLAFVAVTILLQVTSVEVYNRGSISFAGTGLLALGFAFGAGAAMTVAATMGVINLVRRSGRLNRGVFDMAQFALAAGAGSGVYHALTSGGDVLGRIAPTMAAACVYMVVNIGLLTLAMSLAEGESPVAIWQERFRWFTPYLLASGPLALSLTLAYEKMDVTGLLAFTLPPVAMMYSIRQYTSRTKKSVEEVRRANDELRQANAELEARNEDLQTLFEFAGGLSARAHDVEMLRLYARESLSTLTGARVEIEIGEDEGEGGISLVAGGERIASLRLDRVPRVAGERWERLREAIVPQLATAIESASLVDQMRKKNLETIAALARSMEAKDYYTGGHTERVSDVAVSLAKRLGYEGVELDAVEIGALLHDIGKIGIPERILHKPGPLDDEEWKVMKEHPIISEYILSEVDLHPFVTQIARSSHERMDGNGYPDGLRSEEIPLPARIVLVADAFDALTSDRPYRRGRSVTGALEEMRAHTGTQFCPQVVAALEDIFRQEPHVLGAAHLRAVDEAAA